MIVDQEKIDPYNEIIGQAEQVILRGKQISVGEPAVEKVPDPVQEKTGDQEPGILINSEVGQYYKKQDLYKTDNGNGKMGPGKADIEEPDAGQDQTEEKIPVKSLNKRCNQYGYHC